MVDDGLEYDITCKDPFPTWAQVVSISLPGGKKILHVSEVEVIEAGEFKLFSLTIKDDIRIRSQKYLAVQPLCFSTTANIVKILSDKCSNQVHVMSNGNAAIFQAKLMGTYEFLKRDKNGLGIWKHSGAEYFLHRTRNGASWCVSKIMLLDNQSLTLCYCQPRVQGQLILFDLTLAD